MKNNEKYRLTEDEIFEFIADYYIEKFKMRRYRFDFSYCRDSDLETCYCDIESYYLGLSSDEVKMIRKAKEDNGKLKLLETKLLRLGANELVERCKKDDALPNGISFDIRDCDLDDCRFKLKTTVFYPRQNATRTATLISNEENFRKLLKLHIQCRNQLSTNNLVYMMPEYAQGLFKSVCQSLIAPAVGIREVRGDDTYTPFIIELTEIRDITDSIMNPQRDVLGLFSEHYDELKEFLDKYALNQLSNK